MNRLWIAAAGLFLYIIIFFVISRYVIPFLRREPLPTRIPQQLVDAIKQTERISGTPYEYISNCAEYILSSAESGRLRTIIRLDLAFQRDVKTLLNRHGFMHCTQLNHLMRLMLARSSYFTDEQVRLKTTFLNFCIHQYLQVKVAGQWYDIDLWAMTLGVPLGKHAFGLR